MSSSTGSSSCLTLDHLPPPPSEQLCYVHCNLCNTVLAVSVPSSSMLKTVTVRCGHCTNLLHVNPRGLHHPPPPAATSANHHHLHFSPNPHNLLAGGTPGGAPNNSVEQPSGGGGGANYMSSASSSHGATNDLPSIPPTNRPPEKRQRVPSAYNRFIKDEIQRIKAGNPDISHREAFSAAAKNWAHFPHIQFGLMPDQTVKRTSNMRPHQSPPPGGLRKY